MGWRRFQLLLPRLLVREDLYSPKLKTYFENFADYTLSEQQRRKILTPANHSASQYSVNPASYIGQAGNLDLVSAYNEGPRGEPEKSKWQSVFTPHAALLTATVKPDIYLPILQRLESYKDEKTHLYRSGLGWMDGLHIEGPRQGYVVPGLLSLDQAMIALSVAEMLSPDSMSVSARVLYQNAKTRLKLRQFFLETLPLEKLNSR